jgi:hypothetical protein
MNHFEQYIKKYVVLIFTDYGAQVAQDQLLSNLLGDLEKKDLVIITTKGQFIETDKADVNEILIIIHKEKEPSEQLIELLNQIKRGGKLILAGIHNGTPEPIKDKQRELVREGIVKEYIHGLEEDLSPEWFSFSKICLAVHEGKTDKLKQNYVRLVELLLSPVERLSLLKHRLMHLLGLIDNDLQALWDEAERTGRKGFDPEKWREVCDAYKDYEWDKILCNALEMIKETVDEIKQNLSENKKREAEGLLEYRIGEIIEFLNHVKDKNMEAVYKTLEDKKGLNPVHEWLVELDKKLEGLI